MYKVSLYYFLQLRVHLKLSLQQKVLKTCYILYILESTKIEVSTKSQFGSIFQVFLLVVVVVVFACMNVSAIQPGSCSLDLVQGHRGPACCLVRGERVRRSKSCLWTEAQGSRKDWSLTFYVGLFIYPFSVGLKVRQNPFKIHMPGHKFTSQVINVILQTQIDTVASSRGRQMISAKT